MQDVSAEPPVSRFRIPDGVRTGAGALGKWMQIVGVIQTCCAGLGFALFSCSAVATVEAQFASGVVVVTAVVLVMLAILVRQGLLLQSAADHLAGLGDEPDEAHDHLQLAFARLRAMFVIDAALGALLLLRNALVLAVGS